jgi:hypothetical protein
VAQQAHLQQHTQVVLVAMQDLTAHQVAVAVVAQLQ